MAARYKAKIETPYGLRTCFEARIQRDGKPGPGSPVRRDTPRTEEERGPYRPRPRAGPHPRKELIHRLLKRRCELCGQRGQGGRPPSPQTHQPRGTRARPARVGGKNGPDAPKDPHGLPSCHDVIHGHTCHERGIGHWRATCAERCPRGSEEGCAEKDLPPGRHLAAHPILFTSTSRAGWLCRDDRNRPLRGGRRRPRTTRWPADTAVPGVKRAPGPVRVSRVRNVETLLWVRIPGAGMRRRCGKPTVRGAELPGRTGCPGSRCRAAERRQESGAAGPGTPPGWSSYNWPGCRSCYRARKSADVGR